MNVKTIFIGTVTILAGSLLIWNVLSGKVGARASFSKEIDANRARAELHWKNSETLRVQIAEEEKQANNAVCDNIRIFVDECFRGNASMCEQLTKSEDWYWDRYGMEALDDCRPQLNLDEAEAE